MTVRENLGLRAEAAGTYKKTPMGVNAVPMCGLQVARRAAGELRLSPEASDFIGGGGGNVPPLQPEVPERRMQRCSDVPPPDPGL